jgi:hypothetical protein
LVTFIVRAWKYQPATANGIAAGDNNPELDEFRKRARKDTEL